MLPEDGPRVVLRQVDDLQGRLGLDSAARVRLDLIDQIEAAPVVIELELSTAGLLGATLEHDVPTEQGCTYMHTYMHMYMYDPGAWVEG